MNDIELPPLPAPFMELHRDIGTTVYDAWAAQMQAFARAAIEADRAQRVPDVDALSNFIREIDGAHRFGAGALAERICEWLASTPAPAQQSGWTEESGLVLDFANRVELSCYDQGSAECMAAVQQILDGKDRGDGVANEPWESIRRRLISLVAPAPAQQEPNAVAYLDIGAGGYMDLGTDMSDEALSLLPKGRHMLVIAGTYGVDGYTAVRHQEPPQQERKPMTEDALVDGFCGARHSNQFVSVFIAGARFAERHHGIKE